MIDEIKKEIEHNLKVIKDEIVKFECTEFSYNYFKGIIFANEMMRDFVNLKKALNDIQEYNKIF
jgi:hypothetical protein